MGAEASKENIRDDLQPSLVDLSLLGPHPNNNPGQNNLRKQKFSDFCLFPDRFHEHHEYGQGQQQQEEDQLEQQQFLPGSSPHHAGDGLSPAPHTDITKFNFRLRSMSTENSSNPDPPPPRQRSNSMSYYYFDFSFLPEKDPRFSRDEQKKKMRVRFSSTGEEEEFHHDAAANVLVMRPTAAAAPKKAVTNFSFFDYTMIPDKMEHTARHNNNNNNEAVTIRK